MKLSEAMRLGSKGKPQAFGARSGLVFWKGNGPLGLECAVESVCAIQAAINAAGGEEEDSILPIGTPYTLRDGTVAFATPMTRSTNINVQSREFVQTCHSNAVCPSCGHADMVWYLVSHLNDVHRWSREQIADWVATIEAQQEQPATQVLEEVCVTKH